MNPGLLEAGPESFDDVFRGAITHRSGEADPHCSAEITNLLFKSRNQWGLDLLAMDIQRGRDHGIASYNDYRYKHCAVTNSTLSDHCSYPGSGSSVEFIFAAT